MSVIGKITLDTKDFPQGLVLDALIPSPRAQVVQRPASGLPSRPRSLSPIPHRRASKDERERERETEEKEDSEVDGCLFLEPKMCVECSHVLIDLLFSQLFKQLDLSDASRTLGGGGGVPIPAQQPTPPPRHTRTYACAHTHAHRLPSFPWCSLGAGRWSPGGRGPFLPLSPDLQARWPESLLAVDRASPTPSAGLITCCSWRSMPRGSETRPSGIVLCWKLRSWLGILLVVEHSRTFYGDHIGSSRH